MDTSVDDGDPTLGRESGIMEIVEREASPVTGAVEPEKTRDDEIEINTELERAGALKPPRFESPQLQAGSPDVEIVDEIVVDDESIEVADDEIESADPLPARPTQPSPSSAGVVRSRPPMRPSARPRATNSNSALPPPRRPSWDAPGLGPSSNFPSSSRPPASGVDPWLLANRTLELARANARITELEEQVAFRDARIVTLEERLAGAQLQIDELGQKLSSGSVEASKRAAVVKSVGAEPARVAAVPAVARKPVPAKPVAAVKAAAPLAPNGADEVTGVVKSVSASAESAAAPSRAEHKLAVASDAGSSAAAEAVGIRLEALQEAERESPIVQAFAGEATHTPQRGTDLGAVALQESPGASSGSAAELSARSEPAMADVLDSNGSAAGSVSPSSVSPSSVSPSSASPSSVSPSSVSPSSAAPGDGLDEGGGAPEADAAEGEPAEGDLRRITGIGPRFEAALRRQGITRLSQIAAWSDADVRQVAKALRIPKSRIVKGRWVESAREAIGNPVASE